MVHHNEKNRTSLYKMPSIIRIEWIHIGLWNGGFKTEPALPASGPIDLIAMVSVYAIVDVGLTVSINQFNGDYLFPYLR